MNTPEMTPENNEGHEHPLIQPKKPTKTNPEEDHPSAEGLPPKGSTFDFSKQDFRG